MRSDALADSLARAGDVRAASAAAVTHLEGVQLRPSVYLERGGRLRCQALHGYRQLLDGLPPWAEALTPTERRLATWTERTLLVLLFVIPLSGVTVLVGGDDDLLAVHVAAHVTFFVVLAGHVALVVRRRLVGRMLPAMGR